MFEFIKPNRLTFKNKMCMFLKPQIKPLLSSTVERTVNLQFDMIKYKYFKPYLARVAQINTDYQNAEKVKNDVVS